MSFTEHMRYPSFVSKSYFPLSTLSFLDLQGTTHLARVGSNFQKLLIKDVHEDDNNGNVFWIFLFMFILMTIEWLMIYEVPQCQCVDHDYDNSYYVVVNVVVHDADAYDVDNDDT